MSYRIPPRLRNSDYTKGAITQDEYLRIAIANDANIAAARKAVKKGEVIQPTAVQDATPDELLADIGKQESDARSNLIRMGFRDLEAQTITANLMNEPDVLRMFNMNYPAIETDVKKRFNPRLITPTFFLEYLREYNVNLNASKGLDANSSGIVKQGINALINSVAEIRTIIPDPAQLSLLLRNVGRTELLDPVLQRIQVLQNALPAPVDYAAIERLNDVSKFQIIQALTDATATLPTKAEVEAILRAVQAGDRTALQKIEDLAASVPNGLGRRLDEILRDVRETGTLQGETIRKVEQLQQIAAQTPSKRKQDWDNSYPVDEDTFISLYVEGKRAYLKMAVDRGDLTNVTKKDLGDKTRTKEVDLNNLFDSISGGVAGLSAVGKPPGTPTRVGSVKSGATPPRKGLAPSTTSGATTKAGDDDDTTTFGLGIGNIGQKVANKVMRTIGGQVGMPKPPPLKRIKIGKGLSVKETPTYREFGKYAIHIPQLEDEDILNVKYKSLGGIPKFKPFPVSDIFRDFLLDVLDGKRPSERVYLQIDPKERKAFEEISIGAGVWSGFGLKRTTTNDDEEDRKRFEVLKGIYTAGNNSPQVSQELRRLIVKFINEGKMKRQQGLNLLMELSI
jgi:hypothetical protein